MAPMASNLATSAAPSQAPVRARTARYQPLVVVLVAVCAGIVADRFWPRNVFAWWLIAGGAWAGWLLLRLRGHDRWAAAVLMLAVAALAASWHHCHWHLFAADELGLFAGADVQPVCLEVVALEPPRRLPSRECAVMWPVPEGDVMRLEAHAVAIRDGRQWRTASGRSQLTVYGPLAQIKPGDRLRVFAQLEAPTPAMNPGQFDFARHCRAWRVLSQLHTAHPEAVVRQASGSVFDPRRWLAAVRQHSAAVLRRHLRPEQAELASVVLLGQREAAPWERREAFVETGTAHLLVVSGLHLGIVAGSLMWLLMRLPVSRRTAGLVVTLVAICYLLLVDARAPVVRATVLVMAGCAAVAMYRRPASFNVLALAALVVLVWRPVELFALGAQLSFLCIAALMWAGPQWMRARPAPDPLDQLLGRSRSLPVRLLRAAGAWARDLALMSGAVWLVTLPLVMARTHVVAPVAVAMNIVLWVPMSLALLAGFVTLLCGTVAAPLAWPAARLLSGSLWLMESAVDGVRRLPGSHFWVPGPADWWLGGFYGLLGLWLAFRRLRPPRRWCVALLAGWIGVGFLPAAMRQSTGQVRATFIAMDHGCSVLVELPDGKALLYDAGRMGSPAVAAGLISGVLWSRGRTHLDAVVLSHADMDHYNAVPELLERFSVGAVYVSPLMFDEQTPWLKALKEAIERAGVPLRQLSAGDRLSGGPGCAIRVLHPPERGALGDDNANSVVLAVEYQGRRLLLTGDLADPGLAALLAEEPLVCDVLLAPHHGSRSSSPPGLVRWCGAESRQAAARHTGAQEQENAIQVVISGSRGWDSRPVVAAYERSGCRVFHTAWYGAVSVQWPTQPDGSLALTTYCHRDRP